MEKYIVKVLNMFSTFVEVEAENEDQAREFAKESLENKGETIQHSYEGTVPLADWPVAKKSDLDKAIDEQKQEDTVE